MSYCSPKQIVTKNKIPNSCIDEELINEMVSIYNKKNQEKINTELTSNEKLDLLIKNLKTEIQCDKEYCLSRAHIFSDIKSKIKKRFRPDVPEKWLKDKKTWLNTLDILDILNQYNEAFTDFKFLTVTPIDFDTVLNNSVCVDRKLCSLQLEHYISNNIFKLGSVFNLDRHYQSGSHWTAMYADVKKGEVYYYDSVARSLPHEIVSLVSRIISQGNTLVNENKLTLDLKQYPFQIVKNQISITDICNFLIKGNNFILYRFCFLIPLEKKYNIQIIDNYELTGKIVSSVLHMIDISKKEHYAIIPGLDELIRHIDNNKLNIDQFVFNWVNSNMNIAINNLLSSIKVVGYENKRANVIDIVQKDDMFFFTFDTEMKSNILIDMSFKGFKNCIQHQFLNTECGMYSINFIDSFLTQNKTFDQIISEPINDVEMNNLRYSKYFSPL